MSQKRPEILIESGPEVGKRFSVPDGGLRLGRSSSNDIHIADEELSRNHCLFEVSGESGIKVIDLASANGTFVNGEQAGAEPIELKVADEILVGSTRIAVIAPDSPVEPLPLTDAKNAPKAIDLGRG